MVPERELTVGSVCTGYGGLDLGVLAALGSGRIAWVADNDPHVTTILTARMPGVLNLGDIRTVDWASVEPVDVLTAGFPCLNVISAAGKRAGIEKGTRSGLWTDIMAAVRQLRPVLVVENVAALRWRDGGLHKVLGDLAEAGFDALWRSVRACDIGAAHRRERVFLLGWPHPNPHQAGYGDVADADRARRVLQRRRRAQPPRRPHPAGSGQAVRGGEVAAHPDRGGLEDRHTPHPGGRPATARRGDGVAADPEGNRRDQGLPSTTGLQGRPDVAFRGLAPDHPGPQGLRRQHLVAVPGPAAHEAPHSEVNWGAYTPAIRRWEQVLGRPAPFPTHTGKHGRPVLRARFVEWLQGLPPGHVADLPLPRTAQLRALGNGVVPQQAERAVTFLLDDLDATLNNRPEHGREANAA